MARSILFSIMFIAGALGVVIFSAAQFTDAEDTTSNTIRAGTIDLQVPSAIECNIPLHGLEGAPGPTTADAQADCDFTVRHNGSLPDAELYAHVVVTGIGCTGVAATWDGTFAGSEYCDATADLTAAQFRVISASLGSNNPGFPDTSTNPLFSDWIATEHSDGKSLATCSRILDNVPVGNEISGSLTLELDQNLTSNNMQGDAITVRINFELAEHGADPSTIDCVRDDPADQTP